MVLALCRLASPLMPVACLMFFICLLAEANSSPFDMMEAESELIAGALTEYSGMGFGLWEAHQRDA